MNIREFKKGNKIIAMIAVVALFVSAIAAPLQTVFAVITDPGRDLTRGQYYDLPGKLDNYLTAGKTLDFDLNRDISEDGIKFRLTDEEQEYTSPSFLLQNGSEGLEMETTPDGDGWFHYSIRLMTIPHSEAEEPVEGEEPEEINYAAAKFRVMTTVPEGTKIADIKFGDDITALPEAYTDDYDTVTLADLDQYGTDYETVLESGRYTFNAKSKTHSEIIKLGWKANVSDDEGGDWKLALDTYWNAACMVWFRGSHIYFCPGWTGGFEELFGALDPITEGTHQLEFGRLRVTAGPNYGKDYVFLKIDGETKADGYTDYYQTEGGYLSNDAGEMATPNGMVCFVGDGVAKQRFSGFGKIIPDKYTTDYDTVTLESLGFTGTDYKTAITSGRYTFKSTSKTHSEIVKFGWKPKIDANTDFKIALDTYWNAACMVWFRDSHIYFCPFWGNGFDLSKELDPITSGTHQVEFGRLRVVEGSHAGKDYVFLKIDGKTLADGYTNYYQTKGGYLANDTGDVTPPNNMVCFVDDGVSQQRFSGFGKPDQYADDVDVVNISSIVPGGVVKDTKSGNELGIMYPYNSTSKTKSTVAKFVLKTGSNVEDTLDGSFMVVDIGGNCGFCRSYIAAGNHKSVMFGWELSTCPEGTKSYNFESNSWYAFEQGRKRVTTGAHKGDDYMYLKIDGELISGFYVPANERPQIWDYFYIEAFQNFQLYGYHELSAKFYVDGKLYKDQFSQKGFTVKKPADPTKEGQYFVGWYTAETGGKKFDIKNTKLTENIKLYARFTKQTVKATFDPANGSAKTVLTVGKNCQFEAPETPKYSDGKYKYVFAGWKNKATGKIFDFENDTIGADTTFVAQYKEKQYYVSYYAYGKLVKKVPFVLSNPTVKGKEPAVPKIANATGAWETHSTTKLTGNMTVNAVYNAKVPTASTAIKLNAYKGTKIYLNTDKIHDYLSTEGAANQTKVVRDFSRLTPTDFQDHQNTTFKWTDSGKNGKYTIYFADNKDFTNAYIITSSKKSLINKVGYFMPGKTYYWFVAGNDTGKCSAVDKFKTVNTPVRYITAGAVTNMRDEGGWMTTDGYKVRYGMVFRGASLDEYHSHIDNTARGVFNYLGINSEIELRGGMNHTYTAWDPNNKNVNYVEAVILSSILNINGNQKQQYKDTFDAMAKKENYPFYFHCSAGADRTGTFGYLLNGLLGVPLENLREDYELTSFSEVGLRTADDYVGDSFDALNKQMIAQYGHGSKKVSVAIENFLKEQIGVSQETIDAIRKILLNKNPVPNDEPYTLTVDVLGKTYQYKVFDGIYFMPDLPVTVTGKLFKGYYSGTTKYNGYAKRSMKLTAKFEDIEYEPYDTITLKDLGIEQDSIWNQSNTLYSYTKTAKSGGRLFQFILEPTKDMGDGPQVALTNDWTKSNYARAWFQTNEWSHYYFKGIQDAPPDLSDLFALEAGKDYKIKFSVRVMKNKGYEGKKVFEVSINGKAVLQYIDCKADLSGNNIFFHGSTGVAKLKNMPVYKTVKLYNGKTLYKTLKVERSGLIPQVKEPVPKGGLPFAGWYTASTGGKLWDENADRVLKNMSLYAQFANVKKVTAIVDGKELVYRVPTGKPLNIPVPEKDGMVFSKWLLNGKPFTGNVTKNMTITAAFEAYQFYDYDEITLKDLGIEEPSILNRTNTLYTYNKTAKTGGRVLQFILIPTKNMADGPQVAITNDWTQSNYARAWFQTNDWCHYYYKGVQDSPPDLSQEFKLEAGKEYKIKFSIRVLKNKGFEGIKVFEVSINGKRIIQHYDCKADLSGNNIFFHGTSGTATLKNYPVYKTVKLYNGSSLYKTVKVERSATLPQIKEPAAKGGLPFAGWYTASAGGKLWDENADLVYKNMKLYAHFADIKRITAHVDGKTLIYRVPTGGTLDSLPAPQKQGNVFAGWLSNGSLFTGKVMSNMNVTASFEPYSFDAYDEISLRDLGINKDQYFGDKLSKDNVGTFNYVKAAETGGRVFKAIYVPPKNMINGPQVSFSQIWTENYLAKLYFTKYDEIYVYANSEVDAPPAAQFDMPLEAGKEYLFEIGVRVLNNPGYKGIKVFTIYINGKLVYEQFNNRMPLEGNEVFLQGIANTGFFRNVDIYKTVSFYNGDKLLGTKKVLRGKCVTPYGSLPDRGNYFFKGWVTDTSKAWDFDLDCVYLDTVLNAKYEKYSYPVLLMVDGVLYKRLNIFVGDKVTVFNEPEKDGYVFDKWLCEDGSEYDMSNPVNEPITLVASFAKAEAPAPEIGDETKTDVKPDEKKDSAIDMKYLWFCIIGLIIIAGETGTIIYKKRKKAD